MPSPVVHFEIIGKNPVLLREYYKALFGWNADVGVPVAKGVSEPGNYGFIEAPKGAPAGIPGGIGGGDSYQSHAIFYVGVENVGEALANAERLGGKRVMGPTQRPDGGLEIAHFTDPEGNLVGLAGPPYRRDIV